MDDQEYSSNETKKTVKTSTVQGYTRIRAEQTSLPSVYVQCKNKYHHPFSPSGNYMYHPLWQSVILHFAHRVYLCVSYDSQNKQLLFP
jgi:hypothetical protein